MQVKRFKNQIFVYSETIEELLKYSLKIRRASGPNVYLFVCPEKDLNHYMEEDFERTKSGKFRAILKEKAVPLIKPNIKLISPSKTLISTEVRGELLEIDFFLLDHKNIETVIEAFRRCVLTKQESAFVLYDRTSEKTTIHISDKTAREPQCTIGVKDIVFLAEQLQDVPEFRKEALIILDIWADREED